MAAEGSGLSSSRAGSARDGWILGAAMTLFVAVYGTLAAVKYRFYLYDDIDLAIFVQALERLLHGSLFSSIRGMNWLGDHASLMLFLIAPVYAVARHPLTLPLVQTAALALGAIPVYRLARREIGPGFPALGWAGIYLASPALGYLDLFEFHPEALSTPALLAAFESLRGRRPVATLGFAGLALLGKEDVALVVAALAVYALWGAGPWGRRLALGLGLLSAASLALSFGVFRPAFGGGEAEYGRMYGAWGTTSGGVLAGVIGHPLRALGALVQDPATGAFDPVKLQYLLHLMLPVMFLPLGSPLALAVAFPIVAEHMLSWRPQQHTIVYQYTALVIPFTIVAAVLGCRNVLARRAGDMRISDLPARLESDPGLRRACVRLVTLALLATALAHVLFGPLVGRKIFQARGPIERHWPTAEDRRAAATRDRLLHRLPARGGVVADFPMLSRLAARENLHSIHHVLGGTYTFSTKPYPIPSGVTAVLADLADERQRVYLDAGTGGRLRELFARNRLRVIEAEGDLVLAVAGGRDSMTLVEAGRFEPESLRATFDSRLAICATDLAAAPVEPGGLLRVRTVWRRVGRIDEPCLIEWLVIDAGGNLVEHRVHVLGYAIEPPADWPDDREVRESYRLPLPASLTPGVYTLALRVGWKRGSRLVPATAAGSRGEGADAAGVVELGRFLVGPPPLAARAGR